jgi:hypothetical protein
VGGDAVVDGGGACDEGDSGAVEESLTSLIPG